MPHLTGHAATSPDVLVAHRYEGKGKTEASPYPRPSQRLFRLVAGAVVHGILPPFINRHLVTHDGIVTHALTQAPANALYRLVTGAIVYGTIYTLSFMTAS